MDANNNDEIILRDAGFQPPVRLAGEYPAGPVRPIDAYNWEQAMRVLRKNRRFTLIFASLLTLLIAVFAILMKDVYQPVARLEVDPPSTGIFTLRELETASENNQDYQETQAQILQSDALAMSVIRTLHLDRNPAIVGEKALAQYGTVEIAATARQSSRQPIPSAAPNRQLMASEQLESPDRTPLEAIALRVFQKQLSVNSVRNSRLIEVSYASHDPHLSQQIVNALVTQYIDRNYKNRYSTTMQTSDWLAGQLDDLRDKVKQSTQALVDYQRKYGLVESDDKDLATTQDFVEANHRWSEAKADRIQLQAYVRMLDSGQGESLPQLRDNQLHQSLTSRYVESRAQLAEARAIYGEANNNVKRLRDQTDELGLQLEADTERIGKEIRTAYNAATTKENFMEHGVEQLRSRMGDVGERMVQYRILKNDAFANTELYHALSARLKEAGITAGLRSNNIRVVDPAPVLDVPTGPQRPLIVAMGGVLSGIFGMALAFVKESLNNTVRTPDDIKDWTELPTLSMLPNIGAGHSVTNGLLVPARGGERRVLRLSSYAHSVEAEALRELRTALMLSRPGEAPRVLLVASSAPSEGKTTVAVNLAIVFARHGSTCLVDGDLRRPMIGNTFNLPAATAGLSHALAGSVPLEKVLVKVPEVPGLSVLQVGVLPPNPADLVASVQMRNVIKELRQKFDHVIIDSPPVIPFADARVLSDLTDGVILVGRVGLTTRRAIMRCTQILDEVRAHIIGVVVNGIDVSSADYEYYNYGFTLHRRNKYYDYGYANTNGDGAGAATTESSKEENTKAKAAGA